MEYQMRNWYYFTWLSGDHNVEQHVHSLDKAVWAMRDEPPVRAWGLGGRQVRTDPKYGDIFDHHAVVYEYANGVRVYCLLPAAGRLLQRRRPTCFIGTKGRGQRPQATAIEGENAVAATTGPGGNMYDARARGAVRRHPRGQADQQRRLHGPQHDAGDPRPDGQLHRPGDHLGAGDQLASRTLAPEELRLGRRAADPARQDGKYPVAMPGVTTFV